MKWMAGIVAALLLSAAPAFAQDNYELGPDSLPQPGVPKGETRRFSLTSRVFPGTKRDYSVYVPAQYDPSHPACVMFFQDGGGGMNVERVFDNLINKREMPVTIAVMIPPGVTPAAGPNALARYNRSHEYDGMSGDYARFLLEEIWPQISAGLNLSKNPNDSALCGASSGGIAAFTAAWQRPDRFRRVISYVGSFTDLQGGNIYNALIRKCEPKPIRVFMQEGSNDQDIYSGSWPNGNKDVYDALKYSGYDARLVMGTGPHSGRHGAAILPEALRWIWRDYPAPIVQPSLSRWPANEAWIPGENWHAAPGITGEVGGIAADRDGSIWITLPRENRVVSVSPDGSIIENKTISEMHTPTGIAAAPDGSLYVCEPRARRIIRVFPGSNSGTRHIQTVAGGVQSSHIVVNSHGDAYYTNDADGKIIFLSSAGARRTVSADVPRAGLLTLSPDQTLLLAMPLVNSKWGYSLQVQSGGALEYCQPFYDLSVPDGDFTSGATSLATDQNGWLYVASSQGVQLLDQAGRVNFILSNPEPGPSGFIAFGGPGRSLLFEAQNGRLYYRKVKAVGVLPIETPVRPPNPRL